VDHNVMRRRRTCRTTFKDGLRTSYGDAVRAIDVKTTFSTRCYPELTTHKTCAVGFGYVKTSSRPRPVDNMRPPVVVVVELAVVKLIQHTEVYLYASVKVCKGDVVEMRTIRCPYLHGY